jgi:hypothetical protein
MATEIPLKDIAIAVIGGAAAIAAVLLVFVTFLVAKADALPAETPNSTIKRYVKLAKIGFIPLSAQVWSVLTAYWWLFRMENMCIKNLWVYGFPTAVLSFLLYAAVVMWKL